MADPKPIASLTPRLLARKGAAKPAMRRQSGVLAVNLDAFGQEVGGQSFDGQDDDLGWNDMGHDAARDGPHAGMPAGLPAGTRGEVVPISAAAHLLPEVVRQQRSLSRDLGDSRRSALADGRRAAFTLRVDAQRHLKLRLACAVRGRSAQQLVTEALDRLLEELPHIDDLAALAVKTRS